MTNPLSQELNIVGCCIVCGCVSGIWYDLFKSLRKYGIDSLWVVGVQDICFWVGEIILIYLSLYYANDAVLRWYEFFFIFFGFVLYRLLISDYVILIYSVVIKIMAVTSGKIAKGCSLPFRAIKRIAKKYNKSKVARFVRRKLKKKN